MGRGTVYLGAIILNMNKHLLISTLVLVAIGFAAYVLTNRTVEEPAVTHQQVETATFDGRNASFTVDGESVTLRDGASATPIENSSAAIVTRYFGNESAGDIDGDGLEDQAFVVTRNTGGSGTFYYVVVALNTGERYTTTNAFLIGDRIVPQSTQIRSDARELHVNFADRRQGEPMTTPPSEGKVLLLKVTADGVLEGLMK